MRVVGIVNEQSLVAGFETMLRLGGISNFDVSHDVDVISELLAAGDVDIAICGRITAAEFMSAVGRLGEGVRARTKCVLMTSTQNTELLRLAADLAFDGVIDVYLEPVVVHQMLRNILMMGNSWPGPVDSSASPDMLFLATRDALDRSIISLVALGMTDSQIGSQIGLAPQTVRNRLSKIMGDAGLTNRTQLAHMWLREQSLLIRDGKNASPAGKTL
ncbi:MAG: helix-turn-helix domain-containing protein [Ilumatobacteraceae bacterium]